MIPLYPRIHAAQIGLYSKGETSAGQEGGHLVADSKDESHVKKNQIRVEGDVIVAR